MSSNDDFDALVAEVRQHPDQLQAFSVTLGKRNPDGGTAITFQRGCTYQDGRALATRFQIGDVGGQTVRVTGGTPLPVGTVVQSPPGWPFHGTDKPPVPQSAFDRLRVPAIIQFGDVGGHEVHRAPSESWDDALGRTQAALAYGILGPSLGYGEWIDPEFPTARRGFLPPPDHETNPLAWVVGTAESAEHESNARKAWQNWKRHQEEQRAKPVDPLQGLRPGTPEFAEALQRIPASEFRASSADLRPRAITFDQDVETAKPTGKTIADLVREIQRARFESGEVAREIVFWVCQNQTAEDWKKAGWYYDEATCEWVFPEVRVDVLDGTMSHGDPVPCSAPGCAFCAGVQPRKAEEPKDGDAWVRIGNAEPVVIRPDDRGSDIAQRLDAAAGRVDLRLTLRSVLARSLERGKTYTFKAEFDPLVDKILTALNAEGWEITRKGKP